MKTLRQHGPVTEHVEADGTDAEELPAWSTARHLDETITLQGFHCLHDCRWPGTRNGRIDHVVIGPTGVWLLADEWPTEPVTLTETSLQAGSTSLSHVLGRLDQQAAVVAGILGTDVGPILSIHDVSLPRHAFHVADVRVAGALWPTSQVIARPTAHLGVHEVQRLAEVAVEALRPRSVAEPRITPPGTPVVSLPFVPAGPPIDPAHRASVATGADPEPGTGLGHRRRRRLRRAAALALVTLMALGVAIELTGDRSTRSGEQPAEEAPPAADEAPAFSLDL